MITYIIAAIINGDAFPENDCAVVAWFNISGTPITVPSAVILVIAMALLVRGGMASRNA